MDSPRKHRSSVVWGRGDGDSENGCIRVSGFSVNPTRVACWVRAMMKVAKRCLSFKRHRVPELLSALPASGPCPLSSVCVFNNSRWCCVGGCCG